MSLPNPPSTVCLSPEEISDFIAGAVRSEAGVRLEAHLLVCAVCRQTVNDERLTRRLKAAVWSEKDGLSDDASSRTLPKVDGYEIVTEIKRGGQGVVYEAIQLATSRRVALKILLNGKFASPFQRQRFQREIDLIAGLEHPNIVTIHDSGECQGGTYYAMQFIDGASLHEQNTGLGFSGLLNRRSARSQIRGLLQLHQCICKGVAYAHQHGVIHRDLKPSNILINSDGIPKIVDFGTAKLADEEVQGRSYQTKSGEFIGTLAFASPEQVRCDPRSIDVRTDVYSLGVILYRALTARFPYDVDGPISETIAHICEAEPSAPSRFNRTIDNEVDTIVLKSLAKDPDRRYQSAEQFGRDIEYYLTGKPIEAKRDSTYYVMKKTLKRHSVLFATSVAFFALVLGALALSLYFWNRAVHDRELAVAAKGHAERSEANERAHRNDAEFRTYQAHISGAEAAIRLYDTPGARRHLQFAPAHLRDWEWYFLTSQADHSMRLLNGHRDGITSVQFGLSMERVLSGSQDNSIAIWDLHTGGLITQTQLPVGVLKVAVNHQKCWLAVALSNNTVQLLDARSTELLGTFEGFDEPINTTAISPDGKYLAVGCGEYKRPGRVVVWNTATRKVAATWKHENFIHALAFHPDSQLLAMAAFAVQLWDIPQQTKILSWDAHKDWILGVSFSDDGKRIATAGRDHLAKIWDTDSGTLVQTLRGHTDYVSDVQFDSTNDRIFTSSRDRTIRSWNMHDGVETAVLLGHTNGVNDIALSDDGKRLVSGGWDQGIRVWRVEPQYSRSLISGHKSSIWGLDISADGKMFASGSFDRSVRIWDAETHGKLHTLRGHTEAVLSVAFNHDGQYLASGSADGTVRIWDKEWQQCGVLRGHDAAITSIAFLPESDILISGSKDKSIRFWNSSSNAEIACLQGHDHGISAVTVSPDGARIASSDYERIIVWDVANRKQINSWTKGYCFLDDVYPLVFHPDGRLLAGTAQDQESRVNIWDSETGEIVSTLRTGESWAVSLGFNPSGTRLFGACRGGKLKLWDIARSEELVSLQDFKGTVDSIAIGPLGDLVLGGLHDGSIKVWSLNKSH